MQFGVPGRRGNSEWRKGIRDSLLNQVTLQPRQEGPEARQSNKRDTGCPRHRNKLGVVEEEKSVRLEHCVQGERGAC